MKNLLFPLLLAATVLSAPAQAAKGPVARKPAAAVIANEPYKVQPQLSSLGWTGKKIGGQHSGTISLKEGIVLVKGSQIVGGTIVADMTSLKNTDLTDADYNAKLVGHLKSEDFFGVEKNPTATFVITSIKPLKGDAAGNNAIITGNLTIKGKTNPLSFPAKVGVKNGVAAASGTATIDRTKYGVTFGSTLFGTAADKAVEDNFSLSFNVIAKSKGVATR
ncbi:Polyisoprenoid-binding protein YceI [Hymenobacter gelipurpurascens]|uniref:Polyisoprenoid-binding protein YceI n=1 Tax=Hymenobacter gelipurpurascens TaxID=89968 RepID=A0A212THA8_9BACT|nr:YceI family protein [Hymenobacter gelipurpurascens]SNC65402.1 Polyisoprenoid-binding protein YceI [Hymenobacter gelipurpurascens]